MKRVKIGVFLIGSFLTIVLCFSFVCAPQISAVKVKAESNIEVSGDNLTTKAECENMADFVLSNFERFKEEYNSTEEGRNEPLTATSCEHQTLLMMIEEQDYGIYLDFNDDLGYMVLSNEFEVFELETEGDLDYLKDLNVAYYSVYDGFEYKDEQGALRKFEYENEIPQPLGDYVDTKGHIIDIKGYVAAKYPSYKSSMENHSLAKGYEHISQFDTSVFIKDTDSGFYSEGNCTMNALYSMMNDWQRNGVMPNLPNSSEVVYYDATTEPYYQQTLNNDYVVNNLVLFSNSAKRLHGTSTYYALDNYPKLCSMIRKTVIRQTGDVYYPWIGGQYDYSIINVGKYIANIYGYPNARILNGGASSDILKYYITIGRTLYLSLNGHAVYGNHAMAAYGYVEYTYETGWWIFKKTKKALFFEVDDGHSYNYYNKGTSVYYDPATSDYSVYYLEAI